MKRVLFLLLATGALHAQQSVPEMTPEEAAMMAAMEVAMTPGEPHAWLAEQVGSFTATVKAYSDPASEPEVSQSRLVRQMELGGRVLHERWTGSTMGMPFEGIGRTGYDNVTQRYWTTWTDNLSTGVFIAYGDRQEDGTLVFEGEMADPFSGQMMPTRTVARHEDDSEHMEMYGTVEGQEVLMMVFQIRRE